ncbi:hypothetical protein AB0P05_26480 [Streptomyces flaveolus]|uniref:hypothetical protein n=1 Tax=Streptomyces flaveolus TaxID=67297 RepID=UPI003444A82C
MSNTTTYRWIMYVSQNIPGNTSFDLMRAASLEDAREQYRAYCEAVFSDDCSMTLYAYSDERWAEAEDFRDTGCPFDYPDRIIERGPNGGIVLQNT